MQYRKKPVVIEAFQFKDQSNLNPTSRQARLSHVLGDEQAVTMKCLTCDDTGHVCENHPDKQWPDDCECGAGMPCPNCCDPIPQDGLHDIEEAFRPGKPRRTFQ